MRLSGQESKKGFLVCQEGFPKPTESAIFVSGWNSNLKAQANVVVPPNPHGLNLLKQANRLLDPLTHLGNVVQDNEAFGPMLLEHGDSLLQLPGVFVNVGQYSKLHRLPYVSGLLSGLGQLPRQSFELLKSASIP
jgi:hypothetical protein